MSTRTHGGNPWKLMHEQRVAKERILDFSLDINPLGFPDAVRAGIADHVDEIGRYPDPDAMALREAIAAHHHVPYEAVVPGNGSAELITLVTRLLARVAVIVPTFTEYAWAAQQAGATVASHQLEEARGFQPEFSLQDWEERTRNADGLFLCNPNNPTGVALPKDRVLWFADRCRANGCLLVVDEAYVEFTDHPQDVTVLPEVSQRDNLVVLRSLTKSFAVPGLRLGYLAAPPALAARLRAMQQPWPLNAFALAVGVSLLDQEDYLARSRQLMRELRDEFQQAIAAIPGLRPFPTAVNFSLCKIESAAITSSHVTQRLAGQGLLIRDCTSFPGLEPERYLRLAMRMPEENRRLFRALREVLGDGG